MLPYYRSGHVNGLMGLAMAVGLLIASTLTARWAQRLRSRTLEAFFGILVLAIGILGFFK
jgi:uncharacterized membrane protein YfcA